MGGGWFTYIPKRHHSTKYETCTDIHKVDAVQCNNDTGGESCGVPSKLVFLCTSDDFKYGATTLILQAQIELLLPLMRKKSWSKSGRDLLADALAGFDDVASETPKRSPEEYRQDPSFQRAQYPT